MNLLSIILPFRANVDENDEAAWTPSRIESIGKSSATGKAVTQSRAMSVSAYWAAVRAISEDVAKLPLHLYERMEPRGKRILRSDPLDHVLYSQPNIEQTSFTFRETLTRWALTWGNAFAEIVRNNRGEVVALWPIHPSRA